jgi:lipoyl(octanoyl) transferase
VIVERILELGVVPYLEASELQRELVAKRRAGQIADTLVLLEHPPVYTIGRAGSREHVLATGIEVMEVDRGGDVTYHGPGQLVGYPIVDLRGRGGDVHRYLRDLEDLLLHVLAEFRIAGKRDLGFTGVWTPRGKIAQIGVKVSSGITSHGFALNVDTDAAHWAGIVPCGIADRPVASMRDLLDPTPLMADVRRIVIEHALSAHGSLPDDPLTAHDSPRAVPSEARGMRLLLARRPPETSTRRANAARNVESTR